MKITFPTIVYKCPGNHQCAGGTYDFIQVKSEEDLKEKMEQGYKLTLPEAMGEVVDESPEANEIDEISPPTREEREAKATELEIKFNSRTSDEMLDERIEAKLKEQ